ATREPAGSRTRPGCATRPDTATTIVLGEVAWVGATGATGPGATGCTDGRPCHARIAARPATTTAKTASARTPELPMFQPGPVRWLARQPTLGPCSRRRNSPQGPLWKTEGLWTRTPSRG